MNKESDNTDRRKSDVKTDKPYQGEVEHPAVAGGEPTTPDDKGDPKRRAEAKKTTQRTE